MRFFIYHTSPYAFDLTAKAISSFYRSDKNGQRLDGGSYDATDATTAMNGEKVPTPPVFDEWLLGQCHREDPVGRLAQLRVCHSSKVREVGIEAWIEGVRSGGILADAVDQARVEYSVCVEALSANGHSASFPLLYRTMPKDAIGETFARHRAEPEVTTQQHLHRLHKKLAAKLTPMIRVYLDTNHWIGMRDVILGRPTKSDYALLLDRLRTMRSAGRVICPLSFPLFSELQKQKDDQTRRLTAQLMDELSGGVCLQPPNQIECVEIKRQILRQVLGPNSPDLFEWIWTKAVYACGEAIPIPESGAWSDADVACIQKSLLDILWEQPVLALAEFQDWPSDDAFRSLAEALAMDAIDYRARGVPFERVLQEMKAIFAMPLLKKGFPEMAEEVKEQFPEECLAYAAKGGANQTPDPTVLASVQVKAGVMASWIAANRKVKFVSNDIYDALHASVAIPYVHAACFDADLAQRLKTKPLSFDTVYGVKIASDPGDLEKWLAETRPLDA